MRRSYLSILLLGSLDSPAFLQTCPAEFVLSDLGLQCKPKLAFIAVPLLVLVINDLPFLAMELVECFVADTNSHVLLILPDSSRRILGSTHHSLC